MRLVVLNVACPFALVGPNATSGAELLVSQLDAALVNADHDSIVMAAEGSSVNGILLSMPKPTQSLDRTVRRKIRDQYRFVLEKFLDKWPIDLIHMHGADFTEYLPPAGLPVLVTLHLPLEWYPPDIFHLDRPQTFLHCASGDQQRLAPPACPQLLPPIEMTTPGDPGEASMIEKYFAVYKQLVSEARAKEAMFGSLEARSYAV